MLVANLGGCFRVHASSCSSCSTCLPWPCWLVHPPGRFSAITASSVTSSSFYSYTSLLIPATNCCSLLWFPFFFLLFHCMHWFPRATSRAETKKQISTQHYFAGWYMIHFPGHTPQLSQTLDLSPTTAFLLLLTSLYHLSIHPSLSILVSAVHTTSHVRGHDTFHLPPPPAVPIPHLQRPCYMYSPHPCRGTVPPSCLPHHPSSRRSFSSVSVEWFWPLYTQSFFAT